MLPRASRLRDSRTFTATVRNGRRARSGRLVVYLHDPAPDDRAAGASARVGLIVNKQVGNSVRRHRVSRILRHAATTVLPDLPRGAVLVVRALPGAYERSGALPESLRAAVRALPDRSRA